MAGSAGLSGYVTAAPLPPQLSRRSLDHQAEAQRASDEAARLQRENADPTSDRAVAEVVLWRDGHPRTVTVQPEVPRSGVPRDVMTAATWPEACTKAASLARQVDASVVITHRPSGLDGSDEGLYYVLPLKDAATGAAFHFDGRTDPSPGGEPTAHFLRPSAYTILGEESQFGWSCTARDG